MHIGADIARARVRAFVPRRSTSQNYCMQMCEESVRSCVCSSMCVCVCLHKNAHCPQLLTICTLILMHRLLEHFQQAAPQPPDMRAPALNMVNTQTYGYTRLTHAHTQSRRFACLVPIAHQWLSDSECFLAPSTCVFVCVHAQVGVRSA